MSTSETTEKTLAILPFRFHSEKDKSEAVLSEGLADALAMRLFGVENLNIRPSSSARQFLNGTKDSFKLGKILKVDYILEGYIFPSKDRTRFTVQLLYVPERSILWAAQFDEKETDIFQVEDRVSERIFQAVLPHLAPTPTEPVTDSFVIPDTGEVKSDEVLHQSSADTLLLPAEKPGAANSKYRNPLIALLVLAVLAGSFFLWRATVKTNDPAEIYKPTIIVLPFKNVGAKPEDNSLGVGLAETLTGSLANIKKIFVLSANAGRDASRMDFSPRQINREFNVKYVLRGNLQHKSQSGEIEAFAELVEAENEKVLWSQKLNIADGDISGLQTQISQAVLETLAIETTAEEQDKISKRLTNNGVAYEFYLVGRYQMATRSHDGLHKAINAFTQAMDKDPGFALAYAGLADAYALENVYEIPAPADGFEKAKKYAEQALNLDQNLAEAHNSLGYIYFYGERNYKESENEFRKAIELKPSYAATRHWFAVTLSARGKHEEALKEINLAQKLDPRSAVISSAKGLIYFYARRYSEAIAECQHTVALDTGFVPAYKVLRWTYQAQNDYSSAMSALQKEKSYGGGSSDSPGWMVINAQVEALSGQLENARAALEKSLTFNEVSGDHAAFAYEIALAYAALGDREKTIEWLEKSEEARGYSFNFLGVDPRFDKFREDARFKALVEKINKS
jgi:TolB-like protein/lipoprotein NlpI